MSDFEVCPVGTQARLAAAELRADRAEQCSATEAARADKAEAECRRIYDVISLSNRRSDHLGIRMGEVIAERGALRALVVRFIELCALGDVDETTEAMGWGELIAEAKSAVSSTKGGGNG